MNSPLKKLDQSVFDGLPSEYKFADVDEHGRVFVYTHKPCVKCFDGKLSLIPGNFDATNWQNSLIKRKEIAAAHNILTEHRDWKREVLTAALNLLRKMIADVSK